jgi:UTP--glucose-1-phosphate uridylyltransferase
MKVRKAIIPAAGLGTRFLPATKAQPKEMLPIVDKPAIQYIVEEAVASGIEDIIVVTGRGKRAIEDHFDKSYELEDTLEKKMKYDILEEVRGISELCNIHYIRQKEPLGLGHAIYCAHRFIGDEPFGVLLGDDIVHGEKPSLLQLIEEFDEYKSPVLGVQPVPYEDVSKYGIISINQKIKEDFFSLDDMVEKPKENEAPSNYAVLGRYILTPDIFDILSKTPPGKGQEIQLTDAIKELNKTNPVYAKCFEGNRYDIGDKFGFIKATIEMALKREDIADQLTSYLQELTTDLSIITKK